MLPGRIDPEKEEQDRLHGLLLDMLKEEENKYCADCQAKTPRFAAWNLGIYICTRCAGIHRNLGVHISKVRSVNLDSWTAEQVQTMRVMGNEKARQVYEHELPAQFRRPTTDQTMEQFIRSKYEQKRYMLRDFVYPRVDVNDLPKSMASSTSKKTSHPVVSISSNSSGASSTAQKSNGGTVSNLLDFSDPTPTNTTTTKSNAQNLFNGLSMQPASTTSSNPAPPSASDDFDDFGSFVSAAPSQPQQSNNVSTGFAGFSSAPTSSSSSNLADLTSLPTTTTTETNGKKSNADILSLIGSSGVSTSNSQGPVLVAPGGFTAFGFQAAPQTSTAPASTQNDLYGGLGGINFGAPAAAPAPTGMPNFSQFGAFSGAPPQQPAAQQQAGFNIPNKSNAHTLRQPGFAVRPSWPFLVFKKTRKPSEIVQDGARTIREEDRTRVALYDRKTLNQYDPVKVLKKIAEYDRKVVEYPSMPLYRNYIIETADWKNDKKIQSELRSIFNQALTSKVTVVTDDETILKGWESLKKILIAEGKTVAFFSVYHVQRPSYLENFLPYTLDFENWVKI